MPSNYKGQAGALFPAGSTVSITSSTNASPIVVQTSAAHGCSAGDTIDLFDHQVNTAANGEWIVDVPDATHLSLRGSTGNGVGGATGNIDVIAWPAFQQPSDGDPSNAASINTPDAANADRTTALLVATGAVKVFGVETAEHDVGTSISPPASWASVSSPTPGTWTTTGNSFSLTRLQAGDVLLIELSSTLSVVPPASLTNAGVKLYGGQAPPGGSPTFTAIQGSAQFVLAQAGTDIYVPCRLSGYVTITAAGDYVVEPYVIADQASTTVALIGDYRWTITILRPTQCFQ